MDTIDKFVDGAAVKRVGELNFDIAKDIIDDIISVPEGHICHTILEVYNAQAIVVEPAGALTIAALDFYKDKIKGKNIVCIISGSNNDITRMEEIKEKALLYKGIKRYFIIKFPQRSGALKEFVNEVLGEGDDITRFEYIKKTNADMGDAMLGIEFKQREDVDRLVHNMQKKTNYTPKDRSRDCKLLFVVIYVQKRPTQIPKLRPTASSSSWASTCCCFSERYRLAFQIVFHRNDII